ncbi:ATP-dependent helicase [Oxynema sp. CENA135]|uniref:ATP-dependent helicase n=1 Tax=Oxynema sp. CENA135 TaxID=984206 RepID=UPI00190D195D|nr:ATP-dependent helicase [Oxynema sp. CENA135]MBK4731915.1 ATP-dependent helicase [Oxynema sp. CENA135]
MPQNSDLSETRTTPEVTPTPDNGRENPWERIRRGLRPGQRQMADWQGGSLAVSAVPGAGKSKGMADAAALTIARSQLNHRRQLVVVTFTRSAAANIKVRIRQALETLGLPAYGFNVNTLHGLALNIATQHPEQSGLSLEEATLIAPNQSHRAIAHCVERWIAEHPYRYQQLIEGQSFDGEETERLRRQSVLRTDVLPNLAHTVIHESKSSGLLPEDLLALAEASQTRVPDDDYEILAIAVGLYREYQQFLRSRQLIDYDDMILAALRVLREPSTRQIWQERVYAVFEDEAQDSSPLQSQLLELLATDANNRDAPPNLIRVGDPNQAINSTFTPADPIYFRRFCQHCESRGLLATMDRAGRSSPMIIEAANFTLDWVNEHYPRALQGLGTAIVEEALPFRAQHIYPVDPGDPQKGANPAPTGLGLELCAPRDIYATVGAIARRIVELFSHTSEPRSAAILVRENRQGRLIQEIFGNPQAYGLDCELLDRGIPVYDVAANERLSHVPGEILALLNFIDRPHSPQYLKEALRVLVKRQRIQAQDLDRLASRPEQFLYPGPLAPTQSPSELHARAFCTRLLDARIALPIYQLISFIAVELDYNPSELATADKLGERVSRQTARSRSMASILEVLNEIVASESFEGVDADRDTESIYTRSGQVTIVTMHKAKGLDWDYVFIPFLHENTIPGQSWVPPQAKFLGEFTLSEVARAQIRASLHGQKQFYSRRLGNFDPTTAIPSVRESWQQAAALKMAEEYRLLYVAMTRARRLLWMSAAVQGPFTWSKPENLQQQKPCPVFAALAKHFPESVVTVD